jgi:hypothetical protein
VFDIFLPTSKRSLRLSNSSERTAMSKDGGLEENRSGIKVQTEGVWGEIDSQEND